MRQRPALIVHQSHICGLACITYASWFMLAAVPAHAQWTVINLHPANGWPNSEALATTGTHQVGRAFELAGDITISHASLWNSAAGSWVDLHPRGLGSPNSSALGISPSGAQQVGTVSSGSWVEGASLWNGTAESYIDLHPFETEASVALGTSGTQQVGYVYINQQWHASLWSGTSESWVDLHPEGFDYSFAHGTSGTMQVGSTQYAGDNVRACLWSGTAESWVNLAPDGWMPSVAYAASGTQQVGYAIPPDGCSGPCPSHASVWYGTAESWVDLHPAVASVSVAYGTSGTQQVGFVYIDGVQHASLWSGTAESWVDLSSFVPAGFDGHHANSIWTDGVFTYVAGYGFDTRTGHSEALLWTSVSPGATADLDGDGIVGPADLAELLAQWGECPAKGECTADFDSDDAVGPGDLAELLAAWGGK